MSAALEMPYSFEVLMRYRPIEIIVLWEGRLTTNKLYQSFQIQRQQASTKINKYDKDIAQGIAEEYLLTLTCNREISNHFSNLDLVFYQTEVLQTPTRRVEPQIFAP